MFLDGTEIKRAFEKAGQRMDGMEADYKEVAQAVNEFRSMIKQLKQGAVHAEERPGKFWPNEEMAKEFGECVLKSFGYNANKESTLTPAAGGVLVPEAVGEFIIQKIGQYGKFRKYATVFPMPSGYAKVPKITTDLTASVVAEGASLTESQMGFGTVGMTARKFACYAAVTNELTEDAVIAIGEIVGQSMSRSIAKAEDQAAFLGDGTSTYNGITGIVGEFKKINASYASVPGVVVGSGNAYSELTLANFRSVVGILPDEADENARWYMNKKFYYDVVYPLAETAGNAGIFEILSDKKEKWLLGYPVEFVACMPSTEANSQICAVLGDLQLGAYLAQRKELAIETSREVLFNKDMTAMRGVERIDISAYGVGDGSEAGPIVALATASS